MLKLPGRKYERARMPGLRWVKKFTHRKNRSATRRYLHQSEYDRIPKNQLVKIEDPWCWD